MITVKEIEALFEQGLYKEATIQIKLSLQDASKPELFYYLFLAENEDYANINLDDIVNEIDFNKALELANLRLKSEFMAEYNFYNTLDSTTRKMFCYAERGNIAKFSSIVKNIKNPSFSLPKEEAYLEFMSNLDYVVTSKVKPSILDMQSIALNILYIQTQNEDILGIYNEVKERCLDVESACAKASLCEKMSDILTLVDQVVDAYKIQEPVEELKEEIEEEKQEEEEKAPEETKEEEKVVSVSEKEEIKPRIEKKRKKEPNKLFTKIKTKLPPFEKLMLILGIVNFLFMFIPLISNGDVDGLRVFYPFYFLLDEMDTSILNAVYLASFTLPLITSISLYGLSKINHKKTHCIASFVRIFIYALSLYFAILGFRQVFRQVYVNSIGFLYPILLGILSLGILSIILCIIRIRTVIKSDMHSDKSPKYLKIRVAYSIFILLFLCIASIMEIATISEVDVFHRLDYIFFYSWLILSIILFFLTGALLSNRCLSYGPKYSFLFPLIGVLRVLVFVLYHLQNQSDNSIAFTLAEPFYFAIAYVVMLVLQIQHNKSYCKEKANGNEMRFTVEKDTTGYMHLGKIAIPSYSYLYFVISLFILASLFLPYFKLSSDTFYTLMGMSNVSTQGNVQKYGYVLCLLPLLTTILCYRLEKNSSLKIRLVYPIFQIISAFIYIGIITIVLMTYSSARYPLFLGIYYQIFCIVMMLLIAFNQLSSYRTSLKEFDDNSIIKPTLASLLISFISILVLLFGYVFFMDKAFAQSDESLILLQFVLLNLVNQSNINSFYVLLYVLELLLIVYLPLANWKKRNKIAVLISVLFFKMLIFDLPNIFLSVYTWVGAYNLTIVAVFLSLIDLGIAALCSIAILRSGTSIKGNGSEPIAQPTKKVNEKQKAREEKIAELEREKEKLRQDLNAELRAEEEAKKSNSTTATPKSKKTELQKLPNGQIVFGTYAGKPIKWRVLEVKNNNALIVSEEILEVKRFDSSSNNYEKSEIRKWLNNEFYNTFTDTEKKKIKKTLVDNSLKTTGDSRNKYACENTEDYIFLLSVEEAKKYFKDDNSRMCKGTEHAIKNGLWVNDNNGNSCWWLRSPYCFGSDYARYVYSDGYFFGGSVYMGLTYVDSGVRPACIINL